MKTQVEFRSNKFPPYEGEDEQINPGLWGKRLAQYLVSKLGEKGIKTGEICAEDWGWHIQVDNEHFKLAIGCGHQYGVVMYSYASRSRTLRRLTNSSRR
jgi:hypothetical protein